MIIEPLEDQTFIFSSNLENPKSFFQGYCFIGNDYVFGEKGAKQYEEEVGKSIKGGEDGCYVTAERKEKNYLFSTDFSGNKKIFYYWAPNLWIVSNSISLIAEHLKKHNINLTVNYSQLAAIGIEKGAFFNQLYSTNTFIEGVRLLPTRTSLKISKHGYSLERKKIELEHNNYEDSLSIFVNTWISRLSGLLKNGLDIHSDLTGGADSRTVFTLLNKSNKLCKEKVNPPSLRTKITTGESKDFVIAHEIAQAYNFNINNKISSTINRFSGEESFYSWKHLCLGVYHPIYFPNYGPQPNIVSLGGAGAENHRPFYIDDSIESLIKKNASKIIPNWLSFNFKSEMNSELERIGKNRSKIDPLMLHYREYRNRMHSGRTPQYTALFHPLGSKLLEDVSEVAGDSRIKNGQINYDIMANLLPSILDIPFDHESKDFNDGRKKSITNFTLRESNEPGKFYGNTRIVKKELEKSASAFDLLYADFQESKKKPFAKDFFGKDFINKSELIIESAIENKKFSHAIEGQKIAAIIASGLLS